jgi:O-antigen ligase
MMMLFSLVFSLFRALQARGLGRAAFYGAFALLSLLVLIISGSRSVLAGVAVALLVMFILRFRWKWTYILGAAGFAIGIGGLLVVTPLKSIMLQTIQSQETGALDVSSLLRLRIWQGAIDHFAEWGWFKRLVGEGIGAYSSIQYDQFVTIARRASGAHNNFLHALIETGLVGLVTFLLLFGGILALLYRRSKRDKLSLAFFYITLALLFSGLTQETFWFQPALLNFWLFYMSLLCVILRGQREGAGGEVNAASDGTRH